MKRLAWYTILILATLTAAFLLWQFRIAIFLFILSLTVTAILRPMIDYLAAHRLPRGLPVMITYLAVVTIFAVLILFLIGPVITELQAIAIDLPGTYEQMQKEWITGSWFQQAIAQSLPDLNHLLPIITGGQNSSFIQSILGMTLGSLDLISNFMIVFVLSIYWSTDQEHFKRLWLSLLPSELRARWRDTWQNVENEIGAYLRSELFQSLLTVIFLGVGYQLIGLKYPVLLAAFGAVGWLLVWFGGVIAVIPALLAGLSISPGMGLLAALFTIAVLSFLEFVVEPRLFSKRQRVSSLLVVILVLIMVKQYGIIGLIAAPVMAAVIQIFARQFILPILTARITLPPPTTIQIDSLRERLRSVQTKITERSEPPPPEIINLVDRLDKLIDKTNKEEQFTD